MPGGLVQIMFISKWVGFVGSILIFQGVCFCHVLPPPTSHLTSSGRPNCIHPDPPNESGSLNDFGNNGWTHQVFSGSYQGKGTSYYKVKDIIMIYRLCIKSKKYIVYFNISKFYSEHIKQPFDVGEIPFFQQINWWRGDQICESTTCLQKLCFCPTQKSFSHCPTSLMVTNSFV